MAVQKWCFFWQKICPVWKWTCWNQLSVSSAFIHRMVEVGRDLQRSPYPALLLKQQHHLEQVAQDLENLQEGRLLSLSGQTEPVLCHLQQIKILKCFLMFRWKTSPWGKCSPESTEEILSISQMFTTDFFFFFNALNVLRFSTSSHLEVGLLTANIFLTT